MRNIGGKVYCPCGKILVAVAPDGLHYQHEGRWLHLDLPPGTPFPAGTILTVPCEQKDRRTGTVCRRVTELDMHTLAPRKIPALH